MRVLVTFDPAYSGPPADAVWIVDTPDNRVWFEQQATGIDANSALFDGKVSPLTTIWNVFDHHPQWTEVIIAGAPLTPEVEEAVRSDAYATRLGTHEFRLTRC